MKLTEQNAITHEALMAYVAGTLSAEEKQQVEVLLKNDPFAQDALEGLQTTNTAAVESVISGINKKVRERTGIQQTKGIQLHWTSYAWAAVLVGLLVGIGFVMVNILGPKDGQVAMNKGETAKPEESLFELKANEPSLTSANPVTATDSVVISYKDATPENTTKAAEIGTEKNVTEQKPPVTKTTEIANAVNKDNTAFAKTAAASGGASKQVITAAPSANGNDANTIVTGYSENGKGKSGDALMLNERKETAAAEPSPKADKKAAAKTEAPKDIKPDVNNPLPTTQKVVRGSIIEAEETDNSRVVTMDGAMKNFNSGNYKRASDDFDAILREQPQNADALYFGGISDYINGNGKKSEKNFDKLLKEGSKFQEGSKWYKANILLKKGKKAEAQKLLDELAGSSGSYKERAIKKKAEIEF